MHEMLRRPEHLTLSMELGPRVAGLLMMDMTFGTGDGPLVRSSLVEVLA